MHTRSVHKHIHTHYLHTHKIHLFIYTTHTYTHVHLYTHTTYIHTYTFIYINIHTVMGFPGGSDGKQSACNSGDLGLIPRLGRFPRRREWYTLQYSCLEKSKDRVIWWATVHGIAESHMAEQLTLSLSYPHCDG